MIYHRQRRGLNILGLCILSVAAAGCRQGESGGAASATPVPEESFKEISRIVKEGIEMPGGTIPSGFVLQDDKGGRSQFIVHNTVASEFIPPSKPGEACRGIITVTSQSVYSVRRSDGGDDSGGGKQDPYSALDEASALSSGIEVIDGSLVSSQAKAPKQFEAPADTVNRRADEDVRTYELVYENHRWALKSEIDSKTERFIQNALDRALRLQP